MTARSQTTAHNGSPYANEPASIKRAKADQAGDNSEQLAADQYRARAAASTSDGAAAAADALADLRKVMADNADVLTSSGVLAHVARFAEARGAERYGVLFGVAMRAVLAVPPQVVLPPTIGGEVSLNLLLAVAAAARAPPTRPPPQPFACRSGVAGRCRCCRCCPSARARESTGPTRTPSATSSAAARWAALAHRPGAVRLPRHRRA